MSQQNVEDIYPLTPAQQAMLLYLLVSDQKPQVLYFDQHVTTVDDLEPAALRHAWQRVIDRHPALRTLFVWENRDQPLQVVRRQVDLPWQEHDWRDLPPAERETRFAEFLHADHARAFDLRKAPLTRVTIVRWTEQEWKIVWSFSHFILDGWSMAVVLNEVLTLYSAAREGRELALPPARPFREHIGWLRRQDPAPAKEYWRRTLPGFEPPTSLPFDGTGSPRDTGWAVVQIERPLGLQIERDLRELVRRHQITPYILFQGLWGLLLGRYGATADVVYGSIVSGRPSELDGVESMVGMFINVLPVRLRLDPATELIPWLQQLQADQFEQREFEYCSYEQILVWAGMPRGVPLFESVLVYENYPVAPLRRAAGDLALREAHLAEAGNAALTLYIEPTVEGTVLKLAYDWKRFAAAAAERILSGLESLLTAVLQRLDLRLGDLSLLRPAERTELIAAAAGPRAGLGRLPVHRAFQLQAARTPETVAVISALGTLTYGELDRAAHRLAARLRAAGVGPESIVGLCAERSPEMIVGMLAILEAGGAYLPLDPAYPPERLAFMVGDSGARVLLTRERLLARLPTDRAEVVLLDGAALPGTIVEAPEAAADAELGQLAYVIYTSGSMGRPKGVLVPHAALAHYVESAAAAFGITPADRVLQFASVSFDTSGEEIYPCLTRGATLVLRDEEMVASPERFARETGDQGITVLDLPTAYWHELVAEMQQGLEMPASLRLVILGGEQPQRDRFDTWRERAGGNIRLVNTYGPTEATIVATRCELSGEAGSRFPGAVPIGHPIENTRTYVAGVLQELLPEGVEGELLIGGAGLARGYLGRPDLTAERFVPDPFTGSPGERLYRTGDLARRSRNGELEFRGRTDHQVKIRGYRVELGEIETALRRVAGVREAAAVVRDQSREETPGERRIVAYVVPDGEAVLAVPALRAALKEFLPDYMLPAAFVTLAALPLTASGKIDRRALPAPAAVRSGHDAGFASPRRPLEELLAGIWSDLLGAADVASQDSFFDLGGHSLLATRMISRVRATLGVDLPMRAIFDAPTLAGFAVLTEQARQDGTATAPPPLVRVPRGEPLPTSFSQQRLWFLDQLEPGSSAYNLAGAARLEGPVDIAAMAGALSAIAGRHESLRTTFLEEDGEPRQVIAEHAAVPLPVLDLSALPAAAQEEETHRVATAEARRLYNLACGPLARTALVRLGQLEHVLLVGMHHVISDGWSMGVFVRELSAFYRAFAAGTPLALDELPIQYADFAVWQRQWLSGEALAERLAWWRGQLAGAPQVVELPLDRPRPAVQSYRGRHADLELDADLQRRLETAARRLGTTPFMFLLAGFSALLSRYANQDDVVIGTPIANRDRAEVEDLIGFFANTLALRADLAGDPGFDEMARRVREVALGAYLHQDVPFERLVDELRPARDLSHAPVFQVMLVLQNLPVHRLDLSGLILSPVELVTGRAQFDLSLFLYPRLKGGWLARLEYAADLFDAATTERILGHLRTLLESATTSPETPVSRLPLLTAAERAQLAAWDEAVHPVSGTEALLHGLFEEQARRTPHATAVAAGGEVLSYAALEERSAWLAERLRGLGAGPETGVAVCLERSADLIVALLGVLRAGAFYVPLDPRYPVERLRFLLEDSGARTVVTHSRFAELLPSAVHRLFLDAPETAAPLPVAASPVGMTSQNLAYLIYTSGSTGRPKAVAIQHQSAAELVAWARETFSAEELRGVLASTAVTFDLSVFEIFVPLACGGTVVLAEHALDLPAVIEALPAGVEISLVNTVPSALAELLRDGGLPDSARTLNLAGEALPRWLADRAYARPATRRLCNLYGPSEDTTYSTWTVVERTAERPPSIGRPLHGTHAYVLDAALERLPVGVPGELYLAGAGLARGYLGRPELTAERFLPDAFSEAGGRMYRTGDRARLRPDGELEYLGRLDHQVKVRGFRIELGEVEAALAAQPDVESAVVLAREDDPGEKRLVAYIVATGAAPAVAELRRALQQTLPEPFIPSAFVFLAALPLTAHGKVDRRALPAPERSPATGVELVAPRNAVEEALAAVWTEVLHREGIGVHDNFFALGGDSIRTIQVVARSRKRGIRMAPRQLFQHQTIAGLAAVVEIDSAIATPVAGSPSPLAAGLPPLDQAAFDEALAELDRRSTGGMPEVEDVYPLSPGQQGMLMVVLLSGQSEVYFDRSVVTLGGEVDADLWRRAWQRVVDRHPALRTLFLWEGREQPLQVVCRRAELPWEIGDWSDRPAAEREARLEDFLRQDGERGFDLGSPPLMRLTLIRWDRETWKMVWSFHHLIIDGWSLFRVFGEAVASYAALREGREPKLEPPGRYRDYVAWLQRQDPARAESFWRGALAGVDEPTPLPYDGTGPGGEDWSYGREMSWVPPAEAELLSSLARRYQVTLNTVFQGAWGALLARATGRADVIFGSVVAGRPGEVEGIESVVGFFLNVLPVRVVLGDEELAPALAHLQGQQVEQRDFEHCPLESIQAWSGLPRGCRLIESLLVFQNLPVNPLGVTAQPGFRVLDTQVSGATHYPLTLYVAPQGGGGLDLRLDYHLSRFDAGSARRLLAHLRTLLAGFTAGPDVRLAELPLITAEERRELLAAAEGHLATPAGRCIHALVEEQAARTPDAPAVEAGGRTLTYRELDERAAGVARRLHRLGVGAGSIVGLCVRRSPEMVVGMLAVLKAGGTYLPLDPVYPRERLAFMLEDSGARVLLTQESLAGMLDAAGQEVVLLDAEGSAREDEGSGPATREPLPAHGAYIIYTSGSTGRPKGVLVPHASLVSYVHSAGEDAGIGVGDRVLQFASMSFDTSAEEIYPCLTRGATLVLRDDAMAGPAESFLREVERLGITILDLPTAYWHELMSEMAAQGLAWPPLARLVILGGEQVQAARLELWREQVGERSRLLNTYGPTEATIVTTRRELNGRRDFPAEVPIGRPVPGARVHVVSRGLELLPPGLDGELVIGGAGLARGYLGRPDLTAERFVPDPFAASPGERLYRTGDLARRLDNGELEFRGRIDHQVKVRGFRIELGEIETALRALPGVRDAVAVARDAQAGGKRLVAHVQPEAESALDAGDLRSALAASLPDYMVPSAFALVADLPRTPSGKVDRRAVAELPAEEMRPGSGAALARPRNPLEEMLCGIWSDLLGIDGVGVDDNFFQLGGHSLLVAKLASRVRQVFGTELSMVEIFKQPTVAHLAAAIERGDLGERAQAAPELPPIRRAPRDQPLPLSFPQERVWFLNELTPGGNIAYNFQFTLWARGPLRVAVLDRTLTEIVRRHEVLRTSFPAVDGQPVQVIHEPWQVSLPVADLRALPPEVRHAESERLVFESTQTPFDVSRIPLLRWRLLRLEDEFWELVQVEQHFIHDGWSLGVFFKELKAIYSAYVEGEPSPLPDLTVQYADFAAWQRELVTGPALESLLGFWRRTLTGSTTVFELPADRPRPNRPSFTGDISIYRLPDELYEGLRAFGRRAGFTLYMTTLAGFFSVLHRYTGQEDILLGTNNANRRARELEDLIGMIVNTLVVRGDLSGDPDFHTLLERVREVSLETYSHQDMPFERLVREIRPERQISRNPLFQVMFNFHDAAIPDLDFADLQANFLVRGNRSAKMDLNVIFVPGAEQRVGMQASELDKRAILHWEYNTELFDFPTMHRLIRHFLTFLGGAIENPRLKLSEVPMLTAGERRQVLEEWNDTGTAERIGGRLHDAFEIQADLDPGRRAVGFGAGSLTYGELNVRANRLAHALRRQGVGAETLVGLCVERSLDMVVGLLGILKAGGAYVPLDPSYPGDRLAFVVADAGISLLLTQSPLLSRLDFLGETAARIVTIDEEAAFFHESAENPAPLADGEDLAYAIYTSGSTGLPKGVEIPHRAAVNFLTSMAGRPGLSPADALVAVTTLAFDIAVLELFLPLAVGARIELASRETAADGVRLAALIASSGATAMQATPATWRVLVEAGWEGDPGLKVLCGGEALPRDLADALLGRVGSLWNVYGPTETTVWSALHAVGPGEAWRPMPIGRPIANTSLLLLDRNFQPVPQGVPGELYIGGQGVARGYHHRPELTAERFLPDPFGRPGARIYRTGDLARYLTGGTVEFLGRADHQVKVRGFRIELGEIEAILAAQPAVRAGVVVAGGDRSGDARLVAYVVPVAAGRMGIPELRSALERKLPDYMVPSIFIELAELPLTPNGKVDRKALPAPEGGRPETAEAAYVEPRDPVERILAGIWAEILGVERVGVLDNFFSLGGHSLSAARVLSRVRTAFGFELPLSLVFEKRTIEGMAAAIEACHAAPPAAFEPALIGAGETELVARAAALSDADLDALLDDMMEAENARGTTP